MSHFLSIGLTLILALWLLWVFYLAVMSLKRAKDAGQLSKTALVLGAPVLWIGYLLDAFVNITLMTIVLMEFPKEILVTDRLIRHSKATSGWRLKVVYWFQPLLDPFDPSGRHL